jgi:hypothetical protein
MNMNQTIINAARMLLVCVVFWYTHPGNLVTKKASDCSHITHVHCVCVVFCKPILAMLVDSIQMVFSNNVAVAFDSQFEPPFDEVMTSKIIPCRENILYCYEEKHQKIINTVRMCVVL